jgi:hypothetical protein
VGEPAGKHHRVDATPGRVAVPQDLGRRPPRGARFEHVELAVRPGKLDDADARSHQAGRRGEGDRGVLDHRVGEEALAQRSSQLGSGGGLVGGLDLEADHTCRPARRAPRRSPGRERPLDGGALRVGHPRPKLHLNQTENSIRPSSHVERSWPIWATHEREASRLVGGRACGAPHDREVRRVERRRCVSQSGTANE